MFSRDFSVIAVYCVHYGRDYLEYSIRSIYDRVDAILISIGLESWAYKTRNPIDPDFYQWLKSIPSRFPKIRLIEGVWNSDEDQRNDTISYTHDFDYYFLLDFDEVYDKKSLDALYQMVEENPNHCVFKIPFVHFWRSFGYVLQEETPSLVGRLFRISRRRFRFKYSCVSGYRKRLSIDVPEDICICYHFSYARIPSEIAYKLSTWTHSIDIIGDWYENVFLSWPHEPEMENLFPLQGQDNVWIKAELFDRNDLPDVMKDHPYYFIDII